MAADGTPKKRGRKPTGRDPAVTVQLPGKFVKAIDAAAYAAGESRAGFVRGLLVAGFADLSGQALEVQGDKQRPRVKPRSQKRHLVARPVVQLGLFPGAETRQKRRGPCPAPVASLAVALILPGYAWTAIRAWAKETRRDFRPALRECLHAAFERSGSDGCS